MAGHRLVWFYRCAVFSDWPLSLLREARHVSGVQVALSVYPAISASGLAGVPSRTPFTVFAHDVAHRGALFPAM